MKYCSRYHFHTVFYWIICRCGKDEEQWVRVMAEVVKPLLETQSLEAAVSGSIHSDVMDTLRSVCEWTFRNEYIRMHADTY